MNTSEDREKTSKRILLQVKLFKEQQTCQKNLGKEVDNLGIVRYPSINRIDHMKIEGHRFSGSR